jgi:hypothetical protein
MNLEANQQEFFILLAEEILHGRGEIMIKDL